MLFVVLLSFLHAKQSLTKLSFRNRRTTANRLSSLVLATLLLFDLSTYTPSLYTRWDLDSKIMDSPLVKTKPVALKKWSRRVFNEQDHIATLRAIQQTERKILTDSVVMDFNVFATLCLKQWVAFVSSVYVKKLVHLSLKKIFNVVVRKDSSML